jgi:hypothetical protein
MYPYKNPCHQVIGFTRFCLQQVIALNQGDVDDTRYGENYSLMAMESEHMVDGDGVDDNGGEDGVEIPLSDVESRTNLTPKTKIVLVIALCFTKSFVILGE